MFKLISFDVLKILLEEHLKFHKIEDMFKSGTVDLEELRKIVMEEE